MIFKSVEILLLAILCSKVFIFYNFFAGLNGLYIFIPIIYKAWFSYERIVEQSVELNKSNI